ncbi:acyltransferase family protein [Klenkia brasiliensis]|uniref:Peptidoglycan/LPS O-acetylase OafA/YrhL, contains acyltransferase and SGNH-hydrolase domains n=1 Tax=Klenkia brasiliensis TaxID=333142 RepID=A0A1G7REJ4_9ACTN|nr:acyltransferase [Klenkia brasiliensis]SDG09188.1 Peptidoglycan/LPS O-acetylase OafA/YrhL, contains acyltransferase and SGNH-hydrolase domains [Klenkia brasiliensis]
MPDSTPARTTRVRRLGALDGLRFLAAISVVGFHFTARNSPGWDGPVPADLAPVGVWTSLGRLGVPLFFVISGFVLLMSSWGKDVPHFVASRIGRLFPAYWPAVAFSIVLVLFVWPENPAYLGHEITPAGALLNFTMVQGAFGVPDVDGPYWTLWYEARFYALIVLLMLVGITRRRVLAFCALWPVIGSIAAASGSGVLTTILMPDYAPFFAGGMLIYLIYRDGHDLGTWLLVGMQVAIALNWSLAVYPGVLTAETGWTPSTVSVALVTTACFGLVALVVLTPLASTDARWLGFLGALTYPVYLVHENLGWYVIHLVRGDVSPWAAVGAAFAATMVAALVLHYAVERPFGNRLRQATLNMMTTVAATRDERTGAGRAGHAAPEPTPPPLEDAVPEPAVPPGGHPDAAVEDAVTGAFPAATGSRPGPPERHDRPHGSHRGRPEPVPGPSTRPVPAGSAYAVGSHASADHGSRH